MNEYSGEASYMLMAFPLKYSPFKIFLFKDSFNRKSLETKVLRGFCGHNQHLELHLEMDQKPKHFSKHEYWKEDAIGVMAVCSGNLQVFFQLWVLSNIHNPFWNYWSKRKEIKNRSAMLALNVAKDIIPGWILNSCQKCSDCCGHTRPFLKYHYYVGLHHVFWWNSEIHASCK